MISIDKLFPEATESEIILTKVMLSRSRYKKSKKIVEDFIKKGLDSQQNAAYREHKDFTDKIERAVDLIVDEEVKRIFEYRYIKNHSYTETYIYFRSIMSEKTVCRRLEVGIESIANTLKLWDAFEK